MIKINVTCIEDECSDTIGTSHNSLIVAVFHKARLSNCRCKLTENCAAARCCLNIVFAASIRDLVKINRRPWSYLYFVLWVRNRLRPLWCVHVWTGYARIRSENYCYCRYEACIRLLRHFCVVLCHRNFVHPSQRLRKIFRNNEFELAVRICSIRQDAWDMIWARVLNNSMLRQRTSRSRVLFIDNKHFVLCTVLRYLRNRFTRGVWWGKCVVASNELDPKVNFITELNRSMIKDGNFDLKRSFGRWSYIDSGCIEGHLAFLVNRHNPAVWNIFRESGLLYAYVHLVTNVGIRYDRVTFKTECARAIRDIV